MHEEKISKWLEMIDDELLELVKYDPAPTERSYGETGGDIVEVPSKSDHFMLYISTEKKKEEYNILILISEIYDLIEKEIKKEDLFINGEVVGKKVRKHLCDLLTMNKKVIKLDSESDSCTLIFKSQNAWELSTKELYKLLKSKKTILEFLKA